MVWEQFGRCEFEKEGIDGPVVSSLSSTINLISIRCNQPIDYQIFKFILYSDLPEESFSLKCYPLEEILIEKMAALMGRAEPRDLYDFWRLTESERLDTGHLKPEFERKVKNKGHDFRLFEQKVLEKEKISVRPGKGNCKIRSMTSPNLWTCLGNQKDILSSKWRLFSSSCLTAPLTWLSGGKKGGKYFCSNSSRPSASSNRVI